METQNIKQAIEVLQGVRSRFPWVLRIFNPTTIVWLDIITTLLENIELDHMALKQEINHLELRIQELEKKNV